MQNPLISVNIIPIGTKVVLHDNRNVDAEIYRSTTYQEHDGKRVEITTIYDVITFPDENLITVKSGNLHVKL